MNERVKSYSAFLMVEDDASTRERIVHPFKDETLFTRLQLLFEQPPGKETPMAHAQPHFTPDAQEKETVVVDASFEPLMPKFMTNRKKEVTLMQEALAGQDLETVRKIAHGMKGVGGSYGFDRVMEMAATIEQAAKTADVSTIQRELPLLGSYLARVTVTYE